ncbi:MAG: hypothetical protein E7540_03790 [Ruminococcaceae bacterium]|nr:hypothetical protein [Oscillospiraceae bacterium]
MNKTVYGVLTLLLNGYGLPSFINGNTQKGILTIVSGIITCGIVSLINAIKGIIMGIKILQMTDEAFEAADKKSFEDAIVFFYKD